MTNPDKHFMQRCIELSKLSLDQGDAPFSSLITRDNELIAEGINAANTKVSEHAEITALHNAHQVIGSPDLSGCTLYTSCEPCPMCSFMIREYKISRVVFALPSLYMGGYSKWKILQDTDLTKFNLFFGKPPEVIDNFMED
jgi:tRNA(adenine34) deaminase|tara:strand:- start:722 stop:1144 length:423 start_codon:yes stop_codon:yes gene_type:complete